MLKLFNIGTIDGVTRLQSQLYIGRLSADYIIEDGILKNWGNGEKGFNYYACNIAFEIVEKLNN